jgi:hypothetical protein
VPVLHGGGENRLLAEAFSHKPAILCIEDDGFIRHDGNAPGFLHRISEEVHTSDVRPHPRTTMRPGDEWLITRDLRVELVGSVPVRPAERLTPKDLARYRSLQSDGGAAR